MRNQFFMSPTSVMELTQLSHAEKSVWLALCSFAEWDEEITHGRCFPSLKSIALRSSCTKSTVCKSLNKLEEFGLLQRRKRSGIHAKSTEYLLVTNETSTPNFLSGKRTGMVASPLNGQEMSVQWTKTVRQTDTNTLFNKPDNIPETRVQADAPEFQSLSGVAKDDHSSATLSMLIEHWNKLLVPLGFKSVIKGSPTREEAFCRIIEEDTRRREAKWWEIVIKLMASSDFLLMSAQKKVQWLNIDWMLDESNLVKICEGKYINSGVIEQNNERGYLEVWEEGDADE